VISAVWGVVPGAVRSPASGRFVSLPSWAAQRWAAVFAKKGLHPFRRPQQPPEGSPRLPVASSNPDSGAQNH
jgi:hypothetical protein